MHFVMENGVLFLYKEKQRIGLCRFLPSAKGASLQMLSIEPVWRRHGYGSYLLKEVLRRTGGYDRNVFSLHTAPLPTEPGETAFYEKFGFFQEGKVLVRRRKPDLTAVIFAQQFVAMHCPAPRLCVDATCGNGGDTAFLCRLCAAQGGRVIAMDVQFEACNRTAARLQSAGFTPDAYTTICDSHASLAKYLAPQTADIIMFNFGWLPGAEHTVFSTPESSIPALTAALCALRPGGILSAVLYSGKTIGCTEKEEILVWLKTLPLTEYTVLCCNFANWADTAPLPCFILKK